MLLRNQDRQAIIALAQRTITEPAKILAFGSRVRGDAHDTSDLDLVIQANNKKALPIGILTDLKSQLQNSNIPIIVKISDWHRIPSSFYTNILENHEELTEIK